MSEDEEKERIKKFSKKLGIGITTGRLLWNANYRRYEQIATLTVAELMAIIDVNKTFAGKIIAKARKVCGMGFIPADILYNKRKEIDRITTGSNALDGLLGSGIETGSITEFYGAFKSGKTQIVHQLAVNVQLSKDAGGLEGQALYIDSENTFRPERIVSMSLAMKLDSQETLKKIRVARAYNSEHQIELVNKIEKIFEENGNVRLLIVDSITTHFRSEYIGMSSLHERQQKLNKHLHSLERIADVYNCAVVITNQVLEDPSVIMGDSTKAVGGNIIAHLCQTRVYLRVSRGNKRLARLIDSPVLPEGEVEFKIVNDGIVDV
ncbi:MAG: DNA repair and recombination protein RadA [Promethearchaeota archaeon]|nr:MAG: DNA repair and recombination protein RadA [Candidatus Lokiarchaeota archaeon]